MPGPWVSFQENREFFKDFKIEKGDYYECYLYDESKAEQGVGLWQVRCEIESNKDGIWLNGR